MGWFDAWLDPENVPEGNAQALIRIASTAKDTMRRRLAIRALERVQFTDEVFAFLQRMLGDPAVADAAVYSLGKSVDPRGKALALNIAKSGNSLAKSAAESVDFDLRPPAELLKEAMTSDSYFVVERAMSALAAWGTPEADKALITFRQETWRNLKCTERNSEGEVFYTVKSSRALGQQPTARERSLEGHKAADERFRRVSADLLNLGQPEDVAEYARQCLETPGTSTSFWKLKDYLQQVRSNVNALELRRRIDQGDKGNLEEYLLNLGVDYGESKDPIALLEVLGCDDLWGRLLVCENKFWRREPVKPREATTPLCAHFPEQMAQILIDVIITLPASSSVVLAAAVSLGHCKNCPGSQLQLMLDKLRPLFTDSTWTMRRRALAILLPIKCGEARGMLRNYLATETDFELQTMAKEFLQSDRTIQVELDWLKSKSSGIPPGAR